MSSGYVFCSGSNFGIKSAGLNGLLPSRLLAFAKVADMIPARRSALVSPKGSRRAYAYQYGISHDGIVRMSDRVLPRAKARRIRKRISGSSISFFRRPEQPRLLIH